MPVDHPTATEVEAILAGAAGKSPTDSELLPVFNFLLPTTDIPLSKTITSSASSSTSRNLVHFYCSKSPSTTHREGAIYLLYLFAFKRDGTAKRYLQGLEKSVKGCANCARAFAGVRRRFSSRYVCIQPN
jgi:senataxin